MGFLHNYLIPHLAHPNTLPAHQLYLSPDPSLVSFYPLPLSSWLRISNIFGPLHLAHPFTTLQTPLPENPPPLVPITTHTRQKLPLAFLPLTLPRPFLPVLVTLLEENDLLLLVIWTYLHLI